MTREVRRWSSKSTKPADLRMPRLQIVPQPEDEPVHRDSRAPRKGGDAGRHEPLLHRQDENPSLHSSRAISWRISSSSREAGGGERHHRRGGRREGADGPGGAVPPEEMLAAAGTPGLVSPPLPEGMRLWLQGEDAMRARLISNEG